MKINIVVDISDEAWWRYVEESHYRDPMRRFLSDAEERVMASIMNHKLLKEGTIVGGEIVEDPVNVGPSVLEDELKHELESEAKEGEV